MTESEKYEQSIRVKRKATKEDAERLGCKIGDEYSIIPEAQNRDELFEQFEKLHAQRYFETLQKLFNEKYGKPTEKIIKDELAAINNFIEKANQLSTTETFKNKWADPKESDLYEYSRLANDYYKNDNKPFFPHVFSYFNSNAVQVYAKYFLYKDWLLTKLNKIESVEKRELINKHFIDYLRLNFGTTNWIFDKTEQSEIVPKELTHDYLLSNFDIDDSIYKYYHLPTSNLLSDSEFQKMKDTGFVGNKETALHPYSNIVYGAYYSRSDLVWKLTGVSHRQMFIDGKAIKYFADLIPYLKEYAKGFQDGFNEFDNTQINLYLTPFPDKQDYVNKVFEYLLFKHGWANLRTGFTTNQNNEIVNAFENGQQQGYFYRAWSTVFSSNNLFAPLFQEYFKTLPPQQSEKQEEEQKENELYEKIRYHLGFLLGNCPRKGRQILNQNDFDKLIKWTTLFYENNFEVPEIAEPIQTVNTNDYYTQLSFLYLFDELRKSDFHTQRTRAKTLFNLWESSFVDYKGYSEKNFWRVNQKNKDEVKKLMLLY